MTEPLNVIVAGGGIAGLEGLLALHAGAADRVRLTLISADPGFVYRPMMVAEPFGAGRAYRAPLDAVAADTGARLITDEVAAVHDDGGTVRLRGGDVVAFDALLLAPGGRAVEGVPGATTWWPGDDPDVFGDLVRDLEEGDAKRIAIVIPPGASWPLPAYELALMTAGEAGATGHADAQITVVTPERAPLALFGEYAQRALADELKLAGVQLRTGAVGRVAADGLALEPDGERLHVQRVVALPRIVGPAIEGLAVDEDGFVLADDDGLVRGARRTWAAGDGVASPLKFGGLATHQARRAAAAIGRLAGADLPDPGEPVLHGRLLVGRRTRRLPGRGGRPGAPLWSPAGKVAGEHLPRWLIERGIAPAPPQLEPKSNEVVTVSQPVSAMRDEARYLFEVGRRYSVNDPAVAALGRRMRELRDR